MTHLLTVVSINRGIDIAVDAVSQELTTEGFQCVVGDVVDALHITNNIVIWPYTNKKIN